MRGIPRPATTPSDPKSPDRKWAYGGASAACRGGEGVRDEAYAKRYCPPPRSNAWSLSNIAVTTSGKCSLAAQPRSRAARDESP
jgi:hypothetical protein